GGGHLFAMNDSSSNVSVFNINPDGSLAAAPGSPFALPAASSGGLACDSTGSLLFAALTDDVAQFQVAANGAMSLQGVFPAGVFGAGIDGIAVDPTDANLVVVDPGSGPAGQIAILDISTMQPVLGSPVDGDSPLDVAAGATFDPSGLHFATG